MRFKEFEEAAREAFEQIPAQYREGVDGLTVREEALGHPTLPHVFTLGHCVTEEHLSDYGGPETIRSMIALYWGSFRELAQRDSSFDWEGELWETLTHELRHHLESLAGDDALEDIDYAADELFKREDGQGFDPWYYQHGEALGGGVYEVEGSFYLEMERSSDGAEPTEPIEFDWRGSRYRVDPTGWSGEVVFVRVSGPDFEDEVLEIVLVRRRRWWEALLHALGPSRAARVSHAECEPERIGDVEG